MKQPCRINYMYDNECFNDTVDLVQDTPKVCGFDFGKLSFRHIK